MSYELGQLASVVQLYCTLLLPFYCTLSSTRAHTLNDTDDITESSIAQSTAADAALAWP